MFGVEDVADVGGVGMPLFKDFRVEDWTMSNLRAELHLLVNAFKKDVNDPDRTGIHLDHLTFYYGKYFKKHLQPRHYGMEDAASLLSLVRDTIFVSPNKIMESLLPEDMETFSVFAKLAEEDRRLRSIRLDMGEEDAKLKINMYIDSDYQQRRGNRGNDWGKGGGYKGSGGGSGGGNWQQSGPKSAGKVWGTGPGNWSSGGGGWDKKSDGAGGYGSQGYGGKGSSQGYGKGGGGSYGQPKSYVQDGGYGRQAYGQKRQWGGK